MLEHANRKVVGRVFDEHGVLFVVAENRRINQDILIAPGGRTRPKAATAPSRRNCRGVWMPQRCSIAQDFGPRFGSASSRAAAVA